MATFLLSFLLILLALAGLGLGVLRGRRPLAGSCGGLACIRGVACAGCRNRQHQEPGS